MRGSKHWPFAKVAPLWEWLVPAVRTAMSKVGEQFFFVKYNYLIKKP